MSKVGMLLIEKQENEFHNEELGNHKSYLMVLRTKMPYFKRMRYIYI